MAHARRRGVSFDAGEGGDLTGKLKTGGHPNGDKKTDAHSETKQQPAYARHGVARGYEEGWRDAHLQSEELLDHLTESLAGAQLHLERDADPKSRRQAVVDIDALVRRDVERERVRNRRAA